MFLLIRLVAISWKIWYPWYSCASIDAYPFNATCLPGLTQWAAIDHYCIRANGQARICSIYCRISRRHAPRLRAWICSLRLTWPPLDILIRARAHMTTNNLEVPGQAYSATSAAAALDLHVKWGEWLLAIGTQQIVSLWLCVHWILSFVSQK